MTGLENHEAFVSGCLRQPRRRAGFPLPRAPLTPTECDAFGMGQVSTQTKVTSVVGGSLLQIAPATGPAAPFVAAAGALTELFGAIFHGANPLQVPAARAEQIYEAAADNAYAVAKAGMVTPAQAIAAQQQFLQMGIADLQSRNIGVAAQNSIKNMTKVINDEIAVTQKLPSKITQQLDLTKARALYKGGAGWYADSIQAATQLTDSWLQSLGARLGGAGGTATVATSPSGGFFSAPLLMAALVVGAILLFAGRHE